jgi:hypothetical protein
VVFLFIFNLLCKEDLLITLYQFARCDFGPVWLVPKFAQPIFWQPIVLWFLFGWLPIFWLPMESCQLFSHLLHKSCQLFGQYGVKESLTKILASQWLPIFW